MYSKILVALDGSRLAEQILPYARLIAESFGIPVQLLQVNDPAPWRHTPPFWRAASISRRSQAGLSRIL
jgi:nucleotide-binding universal stress UspA family protein